jgi:4-diphosphocytidyl-2-C-methyl-D-erythritol kinase
MSGSGPTCYGIFQSQEEADEAAADITGRKKKWWVRSTTLRGS